MNLRSFVDVNSRRSAIEEYLQLDLANIGKYSIDEKQASTKNCENMIGAVQVPLGVAGPIKIKDQKSKIKNDYYLPLATTEGALVASVNRGCSAIAGAGGVNVISEKIGITRAPVFEVENISKGKKFVEWVEENIAEIKRLVESTSGHLKLLKITPLLMGRNVWLRFHFDTEDAMGMNMATIAAASTISFIEEQTKSKCVALSGNLCVDKKSNYLNFIEGRGYRINADIVIPDNLLSSILKTNSINLVNVGLRKLMYGSIMSGTIGANAHYANIIAAIFLATGQDIAQLAECSMGMTTVEKVEGGLYVSVYLPNLTVGTVGGGTALATQKEALSLMGLDPKKEKGTARKFAEIIGGAVLAGEISLLASLAEGTLAKAHEKYGRNIR